MHEQFETSKLLTAAIIKMKMKIPRDAMNAALSFITIHNHCFPQKIQMNRDFIT